MRSGRGHRPWQAAHKAVVSSVVPARSWVERERHFVRICYNPRMAAKHLRHIALTRPPAQYVDDQVAQGRHASASQIVRGALRLLIKHEEDPAALAFRPAVASRRAHDEA